MYSLLLKDIINLAELVIIGSHPYHNFLQIVIINMTVAF